MDTGEAICRSYRFGHVLVDVFPELVVIAAPYGASHDDFCDASLFVERYTHAADATFIEDDERALELHVYPNTENLISGRPCELPPVDPRLKDWDEPGRRPVLERTATLRPRPLVCSVFSKLALTEQYLQETSARLAISGLIHTIH
jgi:hypothetical protein